MAVGSSMKLGKEWNKKCAMFISPTFKWQAVCIFKSFFLPFYGWAAASFLQDVGVGSQFLVCLKDEGATMKKKKTPSFSKVSLWRTTYAGEPLGGAKRSLQMGKTNERGGTCLHAWVLSPFRARLHISPVWPAWKCTSVLMCLWFKWKLEPCLDSRRLLDQVLTKTQLMSIK